MEQRDDYADGAALELADKAFFTETEPQRTKNAWLRITRTGAAATQRPTWLLLYNDAWWDRGTKVIKTANVDDHRSGRW